MRDHSPSALSFARQLRTRMSLPEVLLWRELRQRPLGVKFRRQHPVGSFVLDFYCAAARTAIEVDGIVHDMAQRPERDLRRAGWLAAHGIALIRIPAAEVLSDASAVASMLAVACSSSPPPPGLRPATSPAGGGTQEF